MFFFVQGCGKIWTVNRGARLFWGQTLQAYVVQVGVFHVQGNPGANLSADMIQIPCPTSCHKRKGVEDRIEGMGRDGERMLERNRI